MVDGCCASRPGTGGFPVVPALPCARSGRLAQQSFNMPPALAMRRGLSCVISCDNIVGMTDTRTMSGAELKVMLTGLGLTPGWLAEHLNVTSRTILRWLDQDEVPAKAVAAIEAASLVTDKEIERIRNIAYVGGFIYTQRTDDHVAERNTLTATWQRHATFRALNDLRSQGVPVTVAYA